MKIKKIKKIVLLSCLIGLIVNRPIPLDKFFIFIYILLKFLKKEIKFSKYNKFIILALITISSSSFIINFPSSSVQIFFPLFFLIGGILLSKTDIDLLAIIRKILFINVIFGLLAVLLALFFGIDNPFVFSLAEKNLPDIYAPYGFSPTQQVYGTFCILVLIISFEYKKYDWVFYISLFAVLLTLNRCTLIFLGILLFIYKPKIFIVICTIMCIFIIKYWDEIQLILFSTANLDSRIELRRGAELSFWQSHDMLVYIFGRGTPNISDNIAFQTIWERTYIEHGLDFILHCYGFFGLSIILMIIFLFLCYLLINKQWGLALFSLYYLLFEPIFTHEFLASSFLFFIGVILLIKNKNMKSGKTKDSINTIKNNSDHGILCNNSNI